METFRQRVQNIVEIRLRPYLWFTGVCFKGIEAFEKRGDLDGAVEHATTESIWADFQ